MTLQPFAHELLSHLGATVSDPVPWDQWTRPLYVGFRTHRSDSNRIWLAAAYQTRVRFEGVIWYGWEPGITYLSMAHAAYLYVDYLTQFPTMRSSYRIHKAARAANIPDVGAFCCHVMEKDGSWAIQRQY